MYFLYAYYNNRRTIFLYGNSSISEGQIPICLEKYTVFPLSVIGKLTVFALSKNNSTGYISIAGHLYTTSGTMISYATGSRDNTFTIPEGIVRIRSTAFYGCDYLENLIIGSDVKEIDEWAIVWCENIKSIVISAKVEMIGDDLLYGCDNISSITIDSANAYYETIEGVLFTKDGKTIVRYPSTSNVTEYEIPSGVTHIAGAAFFGAVNLTSIKLPDSIEYISETAFGGCENIYGEAIDGVYYLDNWAIGYDGSVANIILKDGVVGIASGAFNSYGDNLVSVVIPSSVRFINEAAFWGESITSISFENNAGWVILDPYDPNDNITIDVTNAETNVENLTGDYYWYNWMRTEITE